MFTWLLVFGIFVFIIRPTFKWPMLDGIPLLDMYTCTVFLLVVWVLGWLSNPDAKRLQKNILVSAILLYTLAMIVSTWLSGYVDTFGTARFQTWLRYIIIFILLVTGIKTERDVKIVISCFSIFYFFEFALLYGGYLVKGGTVVVGAERIALGEGRLQNVNMLGGTIAMILPLIFPLVALCKKYWHYLFVLGYVLVSIRVALLTGSRTTLLMLCGLVILATLFSRYRFRMIPVVLLALPLAWVSLPEDMQNRYRTIWDPTISKIANTTMDARRMGFSHGLDNWSTHPIFGTGAGSTPVAPLSDGSISPMANHGGGAHSLYGQIAGELGTVGIAAFLFMLSCFGINHYNIWKNYKYLREKNLGKEGLYCWWVSLATMYGIAMILIMGLGENGGYRTEWIWFAAFQILAAQIMQEKVTAAMQGKLSPSLPVRR